MDADFSGYATVHGVKCSDGRTIRESAFKHMDGEQIPLVWQHNHKGVENILGHAILEHRKDGVYAHGFFNETGPGKHAKALVEHGDIKALSIFANGLSEQGYNVVHGNLIEVSLVMKGANPDAYIQNINVRHGDVDEIDDEQAIIFSGLTLEHGAANADAEEKTDETDETNADKAEDETEQDKDSDSTDEETATDADKDETDKSSEESTVEHSEVKAFLDSLSEGERTALQTALAHADGDNSDADSDEDDADDEETVEQILEGMSDKEKNVALFLMDEARKQGAASSTADKSTDDSDTTIKHSQEGPTMGNVFDQNAVKSAERATLSHSQISTIIQDGNRLGSLKDSVLAHADEYGITNLEFMFPDARLTTGGIELLSRQVEWVAKVLGSTKHAPFAKIKSIVADLTADEARAKGYITGKQKKDEVLPLLRRVTTPTTIYKKQKLDRDMLLDITEIDIVAWLWWEIRYMLNEEIARAILIGDGRPNLSDDKVKDPAGALSGEGIRSIRLDHDLYAHKVDLPSNIEPDAIVDAVIRERSHYRGSGNPSFYTTDSALADLLLQKDKMGRRLYNTLQELASALLVKEIITVPPMEEATGTLGIIVNLTDYTIGTNKGGELTKFDDFDIDFNQYKYLLEGRMSGALTLPKSAIVLRREAGTEVATVTAPSFDGELNLITIPTTVGVDYFIDNEAVTGDQEITKDTDVTAQAQAGYYIKSGVNRAWSYTYTE